jgi:hypothetical protein
MEVICLTEEQREKSRHSGFIKEGNLEEILNDRSWQKLDNFLSGLSRSERIELIALMLLGRGDTSDTWQDLIKTGEEMPDDEQVRYISGKSGALDWYLRDGALKLLYLVLNLEQKD